jgi:hypothetical protein
MRALVTGLAAALLLAAACRSPKASVECPPGALGAAAWERGLLVLGEFHGTEEAPAVALATACAAARAKGRAWLGLEVPRDEQAAIDRYLAGGDEAALLATPWWTREYQDGRSSRGFLELLAKVHTLRLGGVRLEVVAFDVPSTAGFEGRDEKMAEVIASTQAAHPTRPGVVLVGNIHATRKLQLPRSAASHLAARKVGLLTLDMAYDGGTAWACGRTCGLQPLGQRGPGGARPASGFTLESPSKGFDGWWFAGTLTPSPPAIATSRD